MVNSIQPKVLDELHQIAMKTISYNHKIMTQLPVRKTDLACTLVSYCESLSIGGEVKNRNDELLFYRNTRIATVENPELSFASKYRYPALVRSGFNPEFLSLFI